MRQFFIGLLFVAVLVAVGSAAVGVAYQAGLSTAITTVAATAPEGTIVTPVVPGAYPGYPGYGYGYGPGWGWHGGPVGGLVQFLVTLVVIFVFFGILRAVFFRGRGWSGGGRGGPGAWGGPGGWGGHDHNGEHPWERRAREMHETWHRENPAATSGPGDPARSPGAPPTDRPSTGASGA